MPARDRIAAEETLHSDEQTDHPDSSVTAHRTSPGRYVFTESDNTDAWISSDVTVTVDR